MDFKNLSISGIVIHEIFSRTAESGEPKIKFSENLVTLEEDAMNYFNERVMAAVGDNSHSMLMDFIDPNADDSTLAVCRQVVNCDDQNFIVNSKKLAAKLASAQLSRAIPGGILVVFRGTVNSTNMPIVGLIKAEKHAGLSFNEVLAVNFIKDLFLGQQTKLYKVGVFVSLQGGSPTDEPGNWKAKIYDIHMSPSSSSTPAKYFSEAFLGCKLPANAAKLTRDFYEQSKKFITTSGLEKEEQADLLTSLYTYLKVDKSTTIDPGAFAKTYLPTKLTDSYSKFLSEQGIPNSAISKDLSQITNSLKNRRIRFSKGVQLSGTPEAFNELVSIKIEYPKEGEVEESYTVITIKDRIVAP
jgi:37-kD nucleoid-associated bacterial protein